MVIVEDSLVRIMGSVEKQGDPGTLFVQHAFVEGSVYAWLWGRCCRYKGKKDRQAAFSGSFSPGRPRRGKVRATVLQRPVQVTTYKPVIQCSEILHAG